MAQTFCPIHLPKPWYVRWPVRGIGVLFLYTALTLPANITLADTPLVQTVQKEYPGIDTVFFDIFLTLLMLAVFSVLFHLLLHASQTYRWPNRLRRAFRALDARFARSFVGVLFFFVHWGILLTVAVGLWYSAMQGIALLLPEFFRFPLFHEQPIIVGMGILGLGILLDSINIWQAALSRHFCLKCSLS